VEIVMNVSEENARESLAAIEEVQGRTRKALVSTYCGPFLVLWGAVWVASFLGTHFFLKWVNWIWGIGNFAGIAGMIFIFMRVFRHGPATRNPGDRSLDLRIGLFWPLFIAYIYLWIAIVKPYSGIQLNAFLVTAIMFAYVVIGLWLDIWLMVTLGLVVTGMTLVGFFLVPHEYYCLWMAFAAGGSLLGTGLYMQLRWR
jgi:hypothetical protein